MPTCYKDCKHNYIGVCTKYNKNILTSTHPLHRGLLLHPLQYFTMYYDYHFDEDMEHLIKEAEEHLTDKISKSICSYYRARGFISFKQRKLLLRQFFNCYEERKVGYYA